MITALDSQASDLNAVALGHSIKDLMRNAGTCVARFLEERFPEKKVVFVCGSGNNGGDGFSAALRLYPRKTAVMLLCEPSGIRSEDSRFYYSLLECDILPYDGDALNDYDVIVDCALGTGMKGKVREPYRTFITDSNRISKPIISVDVPSGLGSDLSVNPSATITFMDLKEGMDESNSGEIVICDIGIPIEAYRDIGPGDMIRYPVPSASSHKGMNGKLMIIAGGPYFGAPAMSAMSALRTGADIIRIYAPESVHQSLSSVSPVLMITDLPGDRLRPGSVEMLLRESESFDSVLIGPGLGSSDDTLQAIRQFVSRCSRPLVIDADAIGACSDLRLQDAVLTPHHEEFKKLGGGDPEDTARRMGSVVLLKGAVDVITDGSRTRMNRTGTPAMTGAGTGDVLSGCVAALRSKGMSSFDSACLGAYICGKAGEKGFETKSYGLIATDIIELIPAVLSEGLR